jgi:pyruvate formate lyase activating enzyme
MGKISKREFLKCGLLGIGGVFCGAAGLYGAGQAGLLIPLADGKLWKWSREGMFYSETPRGVKCLICPNECTLKENEVSTCHNRINVENKIYTIAYGNPCAIHIDPIEKKPFFHFLPGTTAYSIATAGCNFACLNCQNWEISQVGPRETQNYDLMPERVVAETLKAGCPVIAYTYSEPFTFYEYTLDTSVIAREKGIKNVIVTAGYINEEPLRKLLKNIDAVRVDLKSFKDIIYLKLNAGKLQPVLNTLKVIKEEGVWLEIVNLVIPGWTDDMDMIREMCNWLVTNGFEDTPLFFSRFQPLYKLTQLPATPIASLMKAREIALNAGMKYVYTGNVPGTDTDNTFCPNCSKAVVVRRGFSILENNLSGGNCRFCGQKIPGVWN